MPEGEMDPDEWCLDSWDIARIMCCCPGLRWLDIGSCVRPGADLFALLQLPQSCTSLLVGGAAFTDAAVPLLLQLTQLEYIAWSWSPELTDAGLEQLTRLDLNRLYVHNSGLSEQLNDEDEGTMELEWDPQKGSVSHQLDALCDLSPVCAPARLKRLHAEAVAAAAREQQLRAQLRRSQAEIKRLKKQLEAARAGQQQ